MPAPMKIVGGGPQQPGVEAIVDPSRGAQRTSISPLDHTYGGRILGHYRVVAITGTTVSIGAKGVLAYLRWTDGSNFAVVTRASVLASYVASTITTGTVVDAALYVRRSSTAAGSGGGAVTVGGDNQKLRKNMGGTLVTDLRIATTGALTAPTGGTQDANPMGYALLPSTFQTTAPASGAPVTATLQFAPIDLYKWDALGQHPIILSAGDDVEFCEYTAGPTTGGIAFSFLFEWAEVAAF